MGRAALRNLAVSKGDLTAKKFNELAVRADTTNFREVCRTVWLESRERLNLPGGRGSSCRSHSRNLLMITMLRAQTVRCRVSMRQALSN